MAKNHWWIVKSIIEHRKIQKVASKWVRDIEKAARRKMKIRDIHNDAILIAIKDSLQDAISQTIPFSRFDINSFSNRVEDSSAILKDNPPEKRLKEQYAMEIQANKEAITMGLSPTASSLNSGYWNNKNQNKQKQYNKNQQPNRNQQGQRGKQFNQNKTQGQSLSKKVNQNTSVIQNTQRDVQEIRMFIPKSSFSQIKLL